MVAQHPRKMEPQELMQKVLGLVAAGPKTIDALAAALEMHTFELNVPIQRLRKAGKIEQDGRECLQRGIRSYWVTRWRAVPDAT